MDALQRAIEISGGKTALARKLGASVQLVDNWTRRGNVPAEHVPAIEAATDGAVTAEQLRPDVPWHIIRGRPASDGEAP